MVRFVQTDMNTSPNLRQDHQLDVFVFQKDSTVFNVPFLIRDTVRKRIGVYLTAAPLINSLLHKHRVQISCRSRIRRNRYRFFPHVDRFISFHRKNACLLIKSCYESRPGYRDSPASSRRPAGKQMQPTQAFLGQSRKGCTTACCTETKILNLPGIKIHKGFRPSTVCVNGIDTLQGTLYECKTLLHFTGQLRGTIYKQCR